MIGYITLGTKDLNRAGAYYDDLLATIGAKRFMEEPDYFLAWARSENECSLAITVPFDKRPASVGNGIMAAIALESPSQVDAFYKKAIELGGTCEGKPGFRPEQATSGFYAGYFRDLDGNKLNAFCMVKAH
ncbi:VOC family protein [Alteromonas oceanisediminis]|uniref:VOC family protein n=1 Tax=Alteromonas oceanisediminis TaxID=2836180 RepID=UPI001BD921FB|nr:VOC family protein [Alteromonas oceanisediminis]MBT0585976.1 VOC family protein [Alteromonas oceanisediminis]